IFGFFSNILANSVIEPAVAAIHPSLIEGGFNYHVHFEYFHGWNAPLFMSIGVVVLGTLLFLSLAKWTGIYNVFSKRLTLNNLYDHGLVTMERAASRLNRFYMTGVIRDYLIIIFAFFILAIGSALIIKNGFAFDLTHVAPVRLFEAVLAFVLVGGVATTIFAKSRLTAIIA